MSMIRNSGARKFSVGIKRDTDDENVFKFSQGGVASIKSFGENPTDDEDLFITWKDNEPNNYNSLEHHVILDHSGETYYFNDAYETVRARAFCEKTAYFLPPRYVRLLFLSRFVFS